jgi:hypothetical protein
MPKIFISHAHEDQDAAHQITTALGKAGLDPWLDVQELRSGEELLKTIAKVLAEAEYFAIVLSRTALTKPWVLAEMRMALTAEIEKGRPKVLVLRLDDCEVPIELRHKLYLDFRGRFDLALTELADHAKGVTRAVPTPKQTILSEMIKNADAELWSRLCSGAGSEEQLKQNEVVDAIRDLRSDELKAAVSICTLWGGLVYKIWESELVRIIGNAADCSDVGARRIMKRLADQGFLNEADDLDYSRMSDRAWCCGGILWVFRRAARRSGVFPALPPPLPERLSSLLAYEAPVEIRGKGWDAVHFTKPVQTILDENETAIVAVASETDPARTWVFRSPDDRTPLKAERYFTVAELSPADKWARRDLEYVGFDLATFDDLGLLRGYEQC